MWYPIPGYPNYECSELGEVRSISKLNVLKPKLNNSDRFQVGLYCPKRKYGHNKLLNRVVLSAKLGRELEGWEECRHLDGDRWNNRMDNLAVGDRINNVIDDYELGARTTSIENLNIAIHRLLCIKSNLLASHQTQSA
jgi:hypothetical protein